MQILTSIFSSFNDFSSSVLLTLMITLLGILFRVKPVAALTSGVRVGVGVWGISLMTDAAVEFISPLGEALTQNYGIANNVIDGGCGVEMLIAYAHPFAYLMIPAGLLLNVVLLLCKYTKTLDVDVENFWGWLFPAAMTYMITGSHLWGLVAFIAAGMVALKLGDLLAPRMQKAYGLDHISFAHIYAIMYAFPAPFFNKLFNLIGLDKIKADPTKLEGRLQAFSDPALIGFVACTIMGLIAGMPVSEALSTALALAAIILLFPQVIGFLAEGIKPISEAARNFMLRKFHSDDYYIGLSCALGVSRPVNMMVNILSIPFYFILALVLPGVDVLPAASVAMSSAFILSYAMPWFDNNIVKGLLYVIIMLIPSFYAATWAAPYLTEAYAAATGTVLQTQVTSATPYLFGDLCAWIASLFA